LSVHASKPCQIIFGFYGNKVAALKPAPWSVHRNWTSIEALFPDLPEAFRQGVDAAFPSPQKWSRALDYQTNLNGNILRYKPRLYLVKGQDVLRYDLNRGDDASILEKSFKLWRGIGKDHRILGAIVDEDEKMIYFLMHRFYVGLEIKSVTVSEESSGKVSSWMVALSSLPTRWYDRSTAVRAGVKVFRTWGLMEKTNEHSLVISDEWLGKSLAMQEKETSKDGFQYEITPNHLVVALNKAASGLARFRVISESNTVSGFEKLIQEIKAGRPVILPLFESENSARAVFQYVVVSGYHENIDTSKAYVRIRGSDEKNHFFSIENLKKRSFEKPIPNELQLRGMKQGSFIVIEGTIPDRTEARHSEKEHAKGYLKFLAEIVSKVPFNIWYESEIPYSRSQINDRTTEQSLDDQLKHIDQYIEEHAGPLCSLVRHAQNFAREELEKGLDERGSAFANSPYQSILSLTQLSPTNVYGSLDGLSDSEKDNLTIGDLGLGLLHNRTHRFYGDSANHRSKARELFRLFNEKLVRAIPSREEIEQSRWADEAVEVLRRFSRGLDTRTHGSFGSNSVQNQEFIRFVQVILGGYLGGVSKEIRRDMAVAIIRALISEKITIGREIEDRVALINTAYIDKLKTLLHATGPFLQKLMQLLADEIKPETAPVGSETHQNLKLLKQLLGSLKSGVSPMTDLEFQRVLDDSFDEERGRSRVLKHLDPIPLGAGTIGQVHSCLIQHEECTNPVSAVVKLLRPNLYSKVISEIKFIRKQIKRDPNFAQMSQLVRKIKTGLWNELDFSKERSFTRECQSVYSCPKSQIDTVKLIEKKQHTADPNQYILLERVVGQDLNTISKELEALKVLPQNPKHLLSLKNLIQARSDRMVALTQSWYQNVFFGAEIFHGDLHGGNIFLGTENNLTKLTLIDFGSCARLTKDEKMDLVSLFLAVGLAHKAWNGILTKSFWERQFSNLIVGTSTLDGLKKKILALTAKIGNLKEREQIRKMRNLIDRLFCQNNCPSKDQSVENTIATILKESEKISSPPDGLTIFNRSAMMLNQELRKSLKITDVPDALRQNLLKDLEASRDATFNTQEIIGKVMTSEVSKWSNLKTIWRIFSDLPKEPSVENPPASDN
jgi:tRNA A-37 threonylcarbamoyl transferase component Bud32